MKVPSATATPLKDFEEVPTTAISSPVSSSFSQIANNWISWISDLSSKKQFVAQPITLSAERVVEGSSDPQEKLKQAIERGDFLGCRELLKQKGGARSHLLDAKSKHELDLLILKEYKKEQKEAFLTRDLDAYIVLCNRLQDIANVDTCTFTSQEREKIRRDLVEDAQKLMIQFAMDKENNIENCFRIIQEPKICDALKTKRELVQETLVFLLEDINNLFLRNNMRIEELNRKLLCNVHFEIDPKVEDFLEKGFARCKEFCDTAKLLKIGDYDNNGNFIIHPMRFLISELKNIMDLYKTLKVIPKS